MIPTHPNRVACSRRTLRGMLLSLALLAVPCSAATWYVSKTATGTNAGTSWTNAWNELDQIAWAGVNAGDTILLDGGATRLVYERPLIVGKSGASGSPITIRVASDAGRNGRVEIFGGRTAILPFSDHAYVYSQTSPYNAGIVVDNRSHIVVDGMKWAGIKVYGFHQWGLSLNAGSSNITFRNLEIFDNGYRRTWNDADSDPDTVQGYTTDGRGISYAGTNLTFDRLEVHDNGQDQFQNIGGLAQNGLSTTNMTVKNTWAYNSRINTVPSSPSLGGDNTGDVWNWHQHTDGVQMYDGGLVTGFKVTDSILGPGLYHPLILGENYGYNLSPKRTWASLQGTVISNTLLLSHNGKWTNAPILDISPTAEPNRDWTVNHLTSHADATWSSYVVSLRVHTDHLFSNSIFVNREVRFQDGISPAVENNIQYNTTGEVMGPVVNPSFVNLPAGGITLGTGFADFDFTPTAAGAASSGSRLTTVNQILGRTANLAAGKTVTTSAQSSGFEGSKAVDSTNSTYWKSTGSYPQWMRVDLGSVQTVSQTEVRPFASRPYKFKVETSVDGTNYTLVLDNTHNTRGYPQFNDTFNPAAARYVRLTVTGAYTDITNTTYESNINNGYNGGESAIVDFKVYGTLPHREDFEDGVADGFQNVSGTWSFVTDGTLTYRTPATDSLSRAVAGDAGMADYAVAADVKVLSWGSINYRTAGLSARYLDTNNYYLFSYDDALGLNIRKKVAGTLTTLASTPFTFTLGTVYRFKAVLNGTKLEFYVNGNLLLTATDSAFSQGAAGLHTAYADARFDNFSLHRADTLINETFEDSAANGWSKISGTWSIVTDGTKVYNTNSADSLARSVVGVPSWANYSVQADVKVASFSHATYKTAGLSARYQDTNNYYLFVHDGGTQLKILKKVNGTLTAVATKNYTLTLGTTYTFRGTVDGSELRFYVNGTLELSAADSDLADGTAGLHTAYADARFDNVAIIGR